MSIHSIEVLEGYVLNPPVLLSYYSAKFFEPNGDGTIPTEATFQRHPHIHLAAPLMRIEDHLPSSDLERLNDIDTVFESYGGDYLSNDCANLVEPNGVGTIPTQARFQRLLEIPAIREPIKNQFEAIKIQFEAIKIQLQRAGLNIRITFKPTKMIQIQGEALKIQGVTLKIKIQGGAIKVKFQDIKIQFEDAKIQFEDIEIQFEAIKIQFKAIKNQFKAIKNQFEAIKNQFEAIKIQFEAIKIQRDSIKNQFEAIKIAFEEVKNHFKVTTIEFQRAAIITDIQFEAMIIKIQGKTLILRIQGDSIDIQGEVIKIQKALNINFKLLSTMHMWLLYEGNRVKEIRSPVPEFESSGGDYLSNDCANLVEPNDDGTIPPKATLAIREAIPTEATFQPMVKFQREAIEMFKLAYLEKYVAENIKKKLSTVLSDYLWPSDEGDTRVEFRSPVPEFPPPGELRILLSNTKAASRRRKQKADGEYCLAACDGTVKWIPESECVSQNHVWTVRLFERRVEGVYLRDELRRPEKQNVYNHCTIIGGNENGPGNQTIGGVTVHLYSIS